MRSDDLLSADQACLLVVDVQEAFEGHIYEMGRVIERTKVLIEAAKLLEVPIIVTEQYPKGLGRTVKQLQEVLDQTNYYDKVTFSCCQDEAIKDAVTVVGRRQALLAGIETHVCITQTAYDLQAMNIAPYIAVDAVSCRRPLDGKIAMERMRNDGVAMTTSEAAIMEMTVTSKNPAFKGISKLIK